LELLNLKLLLEFMLEDLLKEPFEPELPPLALAMPVVVRIRARVVSCRMERFIGISFAAQGSGLSFGDGGLFTFLTRLIHLVTVFRPGLPL
jgi:hypothetical protein